jgi:hypothetical protein
MMGDEEKLKSFKVCRVATNDEEANLANGSLAH